MKIILVRHYKVNISHESFLDSDGYSKYCTDYNIMPIIEGQAPTLPDYRIYASNMDRAKETARLVVGIEPEELDGVYEVTFNGFLKNKVKLPFFLWELCARLQWLFNNKKQKEILSDTKKRLNKAADYLIEKEENCIVFMHSIAMKVFSRVLVSRGFRGRKIWYVKNGEAVVFEKDKR